MTSVSQKRSHGGARQGAGRRRKCTTSVMKTIKLSQDIYSRLWRLKVQWQVSSFGELAGLLLVFVESCSCQRHEAPESEDSLPSKRIRTDDSREYEGVLNLCSTPNQ
ncbi:uncharacterized protein LOC134188051 isoform X2 [Corticium candelabrum]|nr:uncharacterized protein LOC134188051 isoform X2 [Corticium candelabrum]